MFITIWLNNKGGVLWKTCAGFVLGSIADKCQTTCSINKDHSQHALRCVLLANQDISDSPKERLGSYPNRELYQIYNTNLQSVLKKSPRVSNPSKMYKRFYLLSRWMGAWCYAYHIYDLAASHSVSSGNASSCHPVCYLKYVISSVTSFLLWDVHRGYVWLR